MSEPKREIRFSSMELRELRAAVSDRAEKLERIRKAMKGAGLLTDEVDTRIEVLEGTDESAGLRHYLSDQIDAFEAGFDAGTIASSPPPADDEAA